MKDPKISFHKCIDTTHEPETSIVLRYRNACNLNLPDEEQSKYNEFLQRTSIREGARIFPLLTYKGVDIHILDETSLMHTKTVKSIDGCVTIARCQLRGYENVVFESGGNTGTALSQYGQRAGLETFLFLPEASLPLLNSKVFSSDKAHLISVEDSGSVKKAAQAFESLNGFVHIPQAGWRHEASRFRGFFILEYLLGHEKFDWFTQTMSAAFGPIGIYSVLRDFYGEIGEMPRYLGIQQEANCPIYRAWKSNRTMIESTQIGSTEHLLTRVMYDAQPQTYGTYTDLRNLLVSTHGDLTTINHSEFSDFLQSDFDGKNILQVLKDNGIEITVTGGEVVEKTGLIGLAGTFKEIDTGKITKGSKILCSLTSGVSDADGRVKPEYGITSSDSLLDQVKDYFTRIQKYERACL